MESFALKRAGLPFLLTACAGLGAFSARAQEAEPGIVLEARGGSSYNGATGRLEMLDLTVSQGDLSITAARGSRIDLSERSSESGVDYEWRLEGDVRLRSAAALITADLVEFVTEDELLRRFVLSGDPARFEDLEAGNAEQAFGEAERLVYDAVEGVVSLDGEVRVVVGQNEFRGCDLIYQLDAEEVTSGESECERPLQITRIPPSEDAAGPEAP